MYHFPFPFIMKITRLLVDKTGAGIFHSNARAFYTGDRTKSRSSSRSRQFVGQERVRVEVMFSFNFFFFISQSQCKTLYSTQIQHVTNWLGKHGILRRLFWWSSSSSLLLCLFIDLLLLFLLYRLDGRRLRGMKNFRRWFSVENDAGAGRRCRCWRGLLIEGEQIGGGDGGGNAESGLSRRGSRRPRRQLRLRVKL